RQVGRSAGRYWPAAGGIVPSTLTTRRIVSPKICSPITWARNLPVHTDDAPEDATREAFIDGTSQNLFAAASASIAAKNTNFTRRIRPYEVSSRRRSEPTRNQLFIRPDPISVATAM